MLKWLMIRIIVIFVSLILIFAFSVFLFKDCGYQDLKIKLETISDNQWQNIILDLGVLSKDNQGYEIIKINDNKYVQSNFISGSTVLTSNELALIKELKGIDFIRIDFSSKNTINILMGGCFDDKLYLDIRDLNNSEKTQISMSWGKYSLKKEMLWQINN